MKRVVSRGGTLAFVVAALCVCVAAQQQQRDAGSVAPASGVAPPAVSGARKAGAAGVEENFELNITERRITERDFYASTSIETEAGEAHGLTLRVGVALGASEIDVLLRNVRGSVRFRGSLEALRRVLDARREPAAPQPTSPPQGVP